MASSVAQAELRREKAWTLACFLVFLGSFCIVFRPIRLIAEEKFVDVFFVYRYEKAFGPGERQKDSLKDQLLQRLTKDKVAVEANVTFPTTTELKVRVPLQTREEAGDSDTKIQKILDEMVKENGKRIESQSDLSGFPDRELYRLGRIGFYRPKVHLKLGLDLQGGVHLVLKARTQNVEFEYKLADNAVDLIAALDAADKADGAAKPASAPTTSAAPATPAEKPAAATTAPATPAAPPEKPAAGATKPAAPAAPAEKPAAPSEKKPATTPDGGQPIRMAQLPDKPPPAGDATGEEDAPANAGKEETVSPEEAKLLSDEDLRQRVVDRMALLVARIKQDYGDQVGDPYGEVVGSNIAIVRTFVADPGSVKGKAAAEGHARILLLELQKVFPKATAKFAEPQVIDVPADAMQQVRDVVMKRIDRLGVSEAEVHTQGTDRVAVELPGVKDPDEAVRLIGTTARLEFRKVPSRYEPETTSEGAGKATHFRLKGSNEVVPTTLVYYEAPEFEGDKNILVGADLKANSANVGFDQQAQSCVNLALRPKGAKKFDRFAQDNFKEYLAIYLDRQVISAPVMNSRHFSGAVQISGGFKTVEEANELKILLNAGALPVPMDVVEQRTVSATLGADAVRQASRAGLVGVILVVLLMALVYRVPGVLADIALVGYGVFVLCGLVMFHATLTLPGILGFLLSLGMAVDANVIIFERLKEEMRQSATRPIAGCIRQAYERALTAIVDGNVTTVIAGVVLFLFGTGPIRGFAVTLLIGVVCHLFTALVVTRRFQNLLAGSRFGQNRKLYHC
ncbi:MAG: protein translocase subunit SecD [Armatimonadetes bacterium]|nr:protein translocase subunit SecD [Armatimonadota bacterium]